MFYYRFWADTEFCGTETDEYVSYETEQTDEELDEDCLDWAQSIHESYEHLVTVWDASDMSDEELEEAIDLYYSNCTCGWHEITKEEFENQKLNQS